MDPGLQTASPPYIYFTAAADTPLGAKTNCIDFTTTTTPIGGNMQNCMNFDVVAPATAAIPGINKSLVGGVYSVGIGDLVTFRLLLENNAAAQQVMHDAKIFDVFSNAYELVSWNFVSPYSGTDRKSVV